MHTFPRSFASTSICTRITVSRSVATTVSLLSATSKRKSSRIGSTVLALMTPEICCSCLSKAEEDAINFMKIAFGESSKLRIFETQPVVVQNKRALRQTEKQQVAYFAL